MVDPGRESVESLVVRAVEPAVGPLGEEGLDEALGLAVGLWAIGPGATMAGLDGGERPSVGRARIGPGVVGQDPLDADPVTSEPDRRVEQGPGRALGALVSDVGHVGKAGGIVDEDLEVIRAAGRRPTVADALDPSEQPMAASVARAMDSVLAARA